MKHSFCPCLGFLHQADTLEVLRMAKLEGKNKRVVKNSRNRKVKRHVAFEEGGHY